MYKKRKTATNRINAKQLDRTAVLNDLHSMLKGMSSKVTTGRIRDKEAFKLQMLSLKSFAYAASVYSSVLDASENEEILRRLEVLEQEKSSTDRGVRGKRASD